MILGIDVSAWQRSISWKAVAAAGIQFAFIKATEGTGYVSPTYGPHCRAARRLGIPVGAYHFARPDADDGPVAEAERFLEAADPRRGDLLPVLDFETQGRSSGAMARWAKRWLRHVEKRLGSPPILYTYPSFWQSFVGDAQDFSDYPLWLASYGKNDGKVHRPRIVGGWTSIAVHQFTSEGRIPGYRGPLDFNRLMRGWTLDRLRLGADPPPVAGYGPPWRLQAKGELLHEAGRLDAGFLARAAEQARAGGVATIRGTPRRPKS